LRETHLRQQQAITEITEIFNSPNKMPNKSMTLLNESSRNTVETKIVENLHGIDSRNEKDHVIDDKNTNEVVHDGLEL
jgi:hypothetical protein